VRTAFVVKSHREGGGFACVLCAQWADADTVCRSIGALMEHLWKDHTCEEMERDEDIVSC
jgi:predicted metal-dependent hydrolase